MFKVITASCTLYGMLFLTSAAQAQISCSTDTGAAERIVCRDASLMELDAKMSQLYHDLQARLPRMARDNLRTNQHGWLRYRDGCSDANCVRRAYNRRIQELNDY